MKGQAYPKYKNSGEEWIGEIPGHWGTKRLKYCAPHINEKYDGRLAELPYTGLEHIESWTGRPIPNNNQITSDGQANRFKPGDVLFGKLRPYLAKILRPKEDGICTGELLVLRSKTVAQDYLFYYMLNRDFISIIDSSTYGAKMPRANWEFIGNLPLLLPPSDEQCSITIFLDRETNLIDTLISKKEQQVELLQEKRATLISNAVTKGLDSSVKMKDSGIDWVGEIPVHWKILRFKYAMVLQRGHDLAANLFIEGEYPVCASNGVIGFHDKYTTEGPSITVGRSGSVGELNYIESNFWAHNTALYVKSFIRAVPKFGYYLLKTIDVKYLSEGTAVGTLNRNHIHRLYIALPEIEEQRNIAIHLYRVTVKIDSLIEKIKGSITHLTEYRKALISAVVTGKIDVRNAV